MNRSILTTQKTWLMLLTLIFSTGVCFLQAQERLMQITDKYLNIPVSNSAQRQVMTIASGQDKRVFEIRLATGEPDYWVFSDMTEFMGRDITISYPGNEKGLSLIYQAKTIAVKTTCIMSPIDAISLLQPTGMEQRPEWPRLSRGGISPFLSAQPL